MFILHFDSYLGIENAGIIWDYLVRLKVKVGTRGKILGASVTIIIITAIITIAI